MWQSTRWAWSFCGLFQGLRGLVAVSENSEYLSGVIGPEDEKPFAGTTHSKLSVPLLQARSVGDLAGLGVFIVYNLNMSHSWEKQGHLPVLTSSSTYQRQPHYDFLSSFVFSLPWPLTSNRNQLLCVLPLIWQRLVCKGQVKAPWTASEKLVCLADGTWGLGSEVWLWHVEEEDVMAMVTRAFVHL